ncbi:MAG: hypothetical protein P9L94_00955 [Candidatus Hinthialibacter antarcticus]|nr:hypothetical protein [Candidatus Hinthialibacter antarcticus]
MNDELRQNLYLYVEAKHGKTDAMPQTEREAFEAQLAASDELRDEMQQIEANYQALAHVPAPQPPDDLAARCLNAPRRTPSRWVYHAARAGVLAVVALVAFGLGVWFQPNAQLKQPFPLLLEKQVQLIAELEASIDRNYQLAAGELTPWSAPIAKLKGATLQMAALYDKRPNDPVIERGLALAVANNITVLQSLNEYIKTSEGIPDFDFTAIQTAPQGAI